MKKLLFGGVIIKSHADQPPRGCAPHGRIRCGSGLARGDYPEAAGLDEARKRARPRIERGIGVPSTPNGCCVCRPFTMRLGACPDYRGWAT
jgi:hypothetical protein